MALTENSCIEFVKTLGSKSPVPGGGGASALVGALGTALGNMVGALTVGKKKYADVSDEIKDLMKRAEKLQNNLLLLVEKDAEVFAPLAKAYGMPNETAEEKKAKAEVMALVLKDACRVPLEIMKDCCDAIDLHEEFVLKGIKLAISDAGVGVIFCKSALQGASLNVYINTKSMEDREYAARVNDEADKMLREYTVKADRVFAMVYNKLKN
ncbi:MAG: cyclodeaminase/cyclohydrolase family protein [Eubacteriales bacterium]|nr:cyclodeaminase/cyclohydrolase family protein [Eubacteriales bacterium]